MVTLIQMSVPLDYCEAAAAAPGSDFALTRVFAPPGQRAALTALYALYHELMQVADQVNDTDAAHAKLAWWQQELDASRRGTGQHPVVQALQQFAPGLLNRDEITALLQGALLNIDPQPPANENALLAFARTTGGMRARLEAVIAQAEADVEVAEQLGTASQCTRWLLHLPKDLERGRLFIPLNDLAHFELTRMQLQNKDKADARERLIKRQSSRIEHMIDSALEKLTPAGHSHLRHLLANAALDKAYCRRLSRRGVLALSQPVKLSPWARLFIAWRAAGRALRQA